MSHLNNTPNVPEHLPAGAPKTKPRHHACVVKEWWLLRVTAGLLVPLSAWFLVSLVTRLLHGSADDIVAWLGNFVVAGAVIVLLGAGFIHTRLGLHEVTLDYIQCKRKLSAVNALIDLLCLVLGAGSITAVIHLYLAA